MLGDRLTSVLRAEDVASVLAYDPELSPDGSVPPDFVWEGERSVVFPASSYSRSMPRHIDAREDADRVLRSHYETCNRQYRRLPACVRVQLNDVLIRDRVIHFRRGGRWRGVYETLRMNDRPYVAADHDPASAPPDATLDDPGIDYVFLGSAGSFNYGHWLVDDLPRIAALVGDLMGAHILVPSAGPAMDGVRLASLQLALGGAMPGVSFLDPAASYAAPRVTYVTPVSHHPVLKLPEALHRLRTRAVRALGPQSGETARRLFVTRCAGRGRGIVNLDEVSPAFAAAGFQPIDPETLSFADQVRAFSGAEAVVGVMGAAMTNTLFCPAGCRVGYLAPEGWVEPFYWDLASVMGHPYFALFGRGVSPELPPHLNSFAVEADDVARFLERIERS